MERRLLVAALLAASVAAGAAERVDVPGPAGLKLVGILHRPAGDGPFPAIVLMHGCSGLWARNGEPTRSYAWWGEHLAQAGFLALFVDSFGPRGEREICTQVQRRVSESRDRPRDAYAALAWLERRPDVRRGHVHLMGWSNGGSSTLFAVRAGTVPSRAEGGFRSAVAFYPGCGALAKASYQALVPTLIQAGGADDWTPAAACQALVRQAHGERMEIDVYPGANHGFDGLGLPVRRRPDVRNLASPTGQGATVGTDPEARLAAIARATLFLEQHDR